MRRTIVAAILTGAAVLVASPAVAAPPEITQRACEADGGTFTRTQGVKKCTYVTYAEVARTYGSLPYQNRVGPLVTTPTTFGTTETQLVGTSRQIDLVRTTTTESQKGSGPVVTTTRQAIVSSRVERLSCEMRTTEYDVAGTVLSSRYAPAPPEDCAELGLFLTP